MPTYEYYCCNCEKNMEIFHAISAPTQKECPCCKKDTLQKQITSGNFVFKGTGFYQTDYKNSNTTTSTGTSPDAPAAENKKHTCGQGACKAC